MGHLFKQCFTLHGPWDFLVNAFALWNLVKEILDPSLEVTRLPDRLPEEGSVVEQSQQTVTSQETLANAIAPVDYELLPPKYDQDNKLLPPKYEQGLVKEKQHCEKE